MTRKTDKEIRERTEDYKKLKSSHGQFCNCILCWEVKGKINALTWVLGEED